ncbi:MAG: hypothetical protein V2I43_03030 [Parvularcula sp.]|jgi:hypothetical protein|nr:hypothetical protein [Parvularcula sp.]
MKRAERPNLFAPLPIAADATLADWIEDQLARSDRARPLMDPVALFLTPTIGLPPSFIEQTDLDPALPHSVSGQCSWNGGIIASYTPPEPDQTHSIARMSADTRSAAPAPLG